MTQRYTRLGHSHTKHSQAHAARVKNQEPTIKAQRVVAVRTEKPDTEAPLIIASFQPAKKNGVSRVVVPAPKRIVDPLIQAGNMAVSWVKAEVNTSAQKTNTSKRSVKENWQSALGLLNTIFKIVLFAVILAILIAVIIIIILT